MENAEREIIMEINIKIDAEFGSEFQKDTAVKFLKIIMLAWEKHLVQAHKKNKIKIIINP